MRFLSTKYLVFTFCCLILCAIEARETVQTSSTNIKTDKFAAEKAEIVDLTNMERKKKGLKPLTVNNHLMCVAQEQSDSMARHHHLSHTVNGKSFAYRVKKSGYPFRHVGENIARSKRTPPHVVQMWMKSHGHRVNILNPQFKEIGIGIATARHGDKYFTQVYGAQR